MLGEYHSSLAGSKEPDGQDINDPLYGNFGGEEEKVHPSVSSLNCARCS